MKMAKGMMVQYIMENLPGMLPGKEIKISEMTVNGMLLTGIIARDKEENVAPVVYLEHFRGKTEQEICEKIADALNNAKPLGIDPVQLLHDRAFVKSHIHPVLCSSMTRSCDMVSFMEIGDMSLLLEIELVKDGYAKVTHSILKETGLSREEALAAAMANVNPTITRMEDTMLYLLDTEAGPENLYETKDLFCGGSSLLVVSNKSIFHGAANILNEKVKARLHELLGKRFFILPSSIHEVICCPVYMLDADSLRNMVGEINQSEVAPDDRLSDKVYVCEYGQIRVA